jgi:hypothetical protein
MASTSHASVEVHMTRSIVFAGLLAAALAACAQQPVPPPAADSSLGSLTSGFESYCGPIWSVGKQGYVIIPCPPGSTYPGTQ